MKLSIVHIILCLILVSVSSGSLKADVDTSKIEHFDHAIDDNVYNELTKELDWSKTKKALRLRPQETITEKDEPKKTESYFKTGGAAIQILGYIAVLILIGFIIYLILDKIKVNPRLEKSEFEVTTLENVEDIEVIDARAGLKSALIKGDYRAALSMHYILVLQHLTMAERIEWEPSKTNRDYTKEMRKDEHAQSFMTVSNAYDLSIYGDRPFGQEEYEGLLPQLQLLSVPNTVVV